MSEIRTNLLSDAAGTGPAGLFKQSAAKAWAVYNGTGTATIDASQGVSSLTDNGSGDFTINYTSSFSTVNYTVGGTFANSTAVTAFTYSVQPIDRPSILVGSTRLVSVFSGSSAGKGDYVYNYATAFGDLA